MEDTNHLNKIDLSKSGINNWLDFSADEKKWWFNYFELFDFDFEEIKKFGHYSHNYKYQLSNDDVNRIIFCLVFEILRYNQANKMNRIIVANSGGLDSAVICGLLSRAMKLGNDVEQPFEVVSYGLSIESNPEHGMRAEEVAKKFGLKHIIVDNLDTVYNDLKAVLVPLANSLNFSEEEIVRGLGNTKARFRMIVNYFSTAKSGSYVMSTDNLSELYMAFWTLMGDVGSFAPIQNILKGLEEPAIAIALGVPGSVLEAKPTDGLNIHKSLDNDEGGDSDAFKGVYYPHLDAIICQAVNKGLKLDQASFVGIDASLIDSKSASQEVVDYLVQQMISPSSVWKRTKGSIGTGISRSDLGLLALDQLADKL